MNDRLNAKQKGPRSRRTRRAIISAARECFASKGVASTSVGAIIRAAGLSRATFYLHYNSKDAIYADIVAAFRKPVLRFYRRLRDTDPADLAAITLWVTRYVDMVRENPENLHLAKLASTGGTQARELTQSMLHASIRILGEKHPFFDTERLDSTREQEQLARCVMALLAVEHTIVQIVEGGLPCEQGVLIDVVARQLASWLELPPSSS